MVTKKKKIAKKTTKKKSSKKTTKASTSKNKTAQPNHGNSKWAPELKPVILNLAKTKTNIEIAMLMGVCEKTFYNWLELYCPELLQPLELTKAEKIKHVEQALFDRAMGYSCKETKTHMTKSGVIKATDIIKHYPPSETAQKYFLGNCAPNDWKEKREVKVDTDVPIRNLSLAFNTDEKPDDVDARGGDEPE